ncbi:APC family permease [Terrisporobacter glycolicus]|uniref:APC family permease n=1 Tax=Terrisporobacter glycolicus TaxID=36841 RepID=UPI003464B753
MSKKKIGLSSLIFMNVSALYGIRWIAKSTSSSFGLGLGAIPMWFIFAILYFIPGALICAELASTYKSKDGGLHDWVVEAYGEKYGFMVSWLNWTAKLFWYSSFLTFLAINVSYAIGNQGLADNKIFVLVLSLIVFWGLSFISTKDIKFAKLFTNTGALGSTIPSILIIVFAFLAVVVLKKIPSASTYTVETITPDFNPNSLVAISAIIFGFTGAETLANFITQIDKPEKNFPKAVIVSALIVATLYVLGSIAITSLMSPNEITASKGILDSLAVACEALGIPAVFIQVIAAGIAISVLGAIVLYIASPIKMLFGSVNEGIFPKKLTKINEHNVPANAVMFQAVLVSSILTLTALLPNVDTIYNILVTMTALTSLFPYVLLFLSYIKLRKDNKNIERDYTMTKNDFVAINIGRFLLVVTLLGVILTATPVMSTLKDNIIYEIEMIGGGALVIISGLMMWRRYEKSLKSNSSGSLKSAK